MATNSEWFFATNDKDNTLVTPQELSYLPVMQPRNTSLPSDTRSVSSMEEQITELTKRLDNHGEIHKSMTEGWDCIKKSLYKWQDHVNDIEQYVSIHHAEYEEMNDRVETQTAALNERVMSYTDEVDKTMTALMSLNRELVEKVTSLQRRMKHWENVGLLTLVGASFLVGYMFK
jgi:chromosome segregation ATPase